MKHLFLVLVMALPLMGADEKKSAPPEKNKLTPKQVADLFADDIGTWRCRGKSHFIGVNPDTGLPSKPVEEDSL